MSKRSPRLVTFSERHASSSQRFIARSLRDFDLSRNESLRALHISASSLYPICTNRPSNTISFLKHVLSTITSSAFSKVIVSYEDPWYSIPSYIRELQAEREKLISQCRMGFQVLREVQKTRAFQLVLCASSQGRQGESLVHLLEEAVAEEKAEVGLNGFFSDPSVVYDPQGARPDYH